MLGIADIIVRRGEAADATLLPDIERSAALAFRQAPDLGWTPGNYVTSAEEHLASIARGTLWVAEAAGRVIGFLTANRFEGELHIDEFDVQLGWQRRGIGRRLIAAVLEQARAEALEAATLTTFRDVPWNGPFYASVGFEFVEAAKLGTRLKALLDREAEHGLPGEKRCAMRMRTGS